MLALHKKLLTKKQIYFIIKLVIDHITSHKFSIPFYTLRKMAPTIFLFYLYNNSCPQKKKKNDTKLVSLNFQKLFELYSLKHLNNCMSLFFGCHCPI